MAVSNNRSVKQWRTRGALTALSIVSAFAGSLPTASVQAQAPESFYTGKTVSVLVGNEAGGGYDALARLVARHIGNHIPGRPNVVVQNMPGGGGLSAANYFVNVGPHDGTELALLARTVLIAKMIAPAQVHFNVADFVWLGTAMSEPGILMAWHTAPDKTAADLFAHELIVGGAGRMDDSETTPMVLNSVLGTKLKVVGGYQGLTAVTLAMERGEVEGVTDWSWSNAKQLRPQYLRDHQAEVLMQFDVTRAADLPDVPTPLDFAKTDADKALLQVYFTTKRVSRPFAVPPGTPADRTAILRTAFTETMKDPDFLADADASHIPIDPSPYQSVSKAMDVITNAPPDIVSRLTRIFAGP